MKIKEVIQLIESQTDKKVVLKESKGLTDSNVKNKINKIVDSNDIYIKFDVEVLAVKENDYQSIYIINDISYYSDKYKKNEISAFKEIKTENFYDGGQYNKVFFKVTHSAGYVILKYTNTQKILSDLETEITKKFKIQPYDIRFFDDILKFYIVSPLNDKNHKSIYDWLK